jgi:hypothetical protein
LCHHSVESRLNSLLHLIYTRLFYSYFVVSRYYLHLKFSLNFGTKDKFSWEFLAYCKPQSLPLHSFFMDKQGEVWVSNRKTVSAWVHFWHYNLNLTEEDASSIVVLPLGTTIADSSHETK